MGLTELERLRLRQQEWDGYEQMHDRLWANMQKKDATIEELKDALQEISNVLGTGRCQQPNCEGCHYEMEEAASIANRTLALLK